MVFLKGLPLAPAAITSASGNPWVAVLFTWGLTQVSSCSPQVPVFEIGTGWLTCSLWLVAVRGVCRGAQCDSRFGDCFLLTCLRCSWLGLFGTWVGISSKFQVMSTDCILKDGCSLWVKKKMEPMDECFKLGFFFLKVNSYGPKTLLLAWLITSLNTFKHLNFWLNVQVSIVFML